MKLFYILTFIFAMGAEHTVAASGGVAAVTLLGATETTPPGSWWMMVGAAITGAVIVWGVNYLLPEKTSKMSLSPQPLQVTKSKEYAEKDHVAEELAKLRNERSTDVGEIKGLISTVSDNLDKFSSDNYKSRRRMHKEINAIRETQQYVAGLMAARGDKVGANHIKRTLARGAEENESDQEDRES